MVRWYQSVYVLPYEAPYETYTDASDVDVEEEGGSSFEPNLSASLLKRHAHRDSGDYSYWDRDRATSPSEASSSDSGSEEGDDVARVAPRPPHGLSIVTPVRLTVTLPRQAPAPRAHTWEPLAQPAEARPPAEPSAPQPAGRGLAGSSTHAAAAPLPPNVGPAVPNAAAAAPSAEREHAPRLAPLRPHSAHRHGSAPRAGVVAMQVRAFEVMGTDDPPTLRSMPPPPRPRSAAPATLGPAVRTAGGGAHAALAPRLGARADAAPLERPRTASEEKRPASGFPLGAPLRGLSPGAQPQQPHAQPAGALWPRGGGDHHRHCAQPAAQPAIFQIASPAIRPAARALRRRSPMSGGGAGNSLELQQWQLQGHQQQRRSQQPQPARPATAGARPATAGARPATAGAPRSSSGSRGASGGAAAAAASRPLGGHALPALLHAEQPAALRGKGARAELRAALMPSTRRAAAASHARGSSTVAYAKTTLRIFEPHVVTGTFLTSRPARPQTAGQGARRERPASARPKSRSAAARVDILRLA